MKDMGKKQNKYYTNCIGEKFLLGEEVYYWYISKKNKSSLNKMIIRDINSNLLASDYCNTDIFKTPVGAILNINSIFKYRKKIDENRRKLRNRFI